MEQEKFSTVLDAKMCCGTYNLIAFRKESFIQKVAGQQVVKFRRIQRPLVELYSELQYVKSKITSDMAVEVHIDGLQNIKMGLDFFAILKKVGCKVYDTWFGEVQKIFDDSDESKFIPSISFKVDDLVSIDKLATVSNGFKARLEPHLD